MGDKYLLIMKALVYRHQGCLYVHHLWRRDLQRHFLYLDRIVLGSPVIDGPPPPEKFVAIDSDVQERIDLVSIVPRRFVRPGLLTDLPQNLWMDLCILANLRGVDVLHVSVNEHPFFFGPLSWFLRRFTRIRLFVMVEATSNWRRPNQQGWRKWKMVIGEMAARMTVRNAAVAAFTCQEYQDSLAKPGRGLQKIIPATWVDEEFIVQAEQFQIDLATKMHRLSTDFRLGFFAHLNYEKGADLALRAARKVMDQGGRISVDIWGDGVRRVELEALAAELGVEVRFRGTVQYGKDFFAAMRESHLVAVPNRNDEQPRIIFDAFSQGVPVVVSATAGNLACVTEGVNALSFPKEDVDQFADRVLAFCQGRVNYRSLCEAARATSSSRSHRAMHQARGEFLRELQPPVKALKASW
ncbi:MAG: glycosyltransferase family 4 protein [Fibrobacteres bacterium]|nr:glycosyltransferase family 4 protein [Fibrobacterota bacterium]